ncbi:glycosyltransferase family 1 protein [Burkholderia sp. GS2Y]|uniref:Glycosyltransferase family 1 protein n=1 Tax=Burkholderia theae TaxID=3143496 RepID=A0ABU9WIW4_9BURK
MSTIFLDVSRLLSRLYDGQLPTGVDRVGLAYIQRYGSDARAVLSERGFLRVLTEKDTKRVFSWLMSSAHDRHEIRSLVARSLLSRFDSTHTGRGVLLHTSHNGMEYPRYYRTLRQRQIRTVFMVHDLIPITHPEYCRPGVGDTHRRRIHTALRHADGLIANSRFTLDSLSDEARRADLPLPPNVIAHLAPGIHAHSDSPSPLQTPYFVMVGTIEPRKNHWFIMHVWRRLVELHGSAAPKLVVIGRRGWECENVVDMLERCDTLRGTVIEASDCCDETLQTWITHARALVFPSFVEGYGMPLIEALDAGVPVLASNLDVFREIADDLPDYLDPLDGPGWLARIDAYTQSDSPARAAQLDRIRAFRAPTWSNHFARVDAFLAGLA